MSNVVVYVFLLDNLAGFKNALNETVMRNIGPSHSNLVPVLRQCDPNTTNQILTAVTKELHEEIIPMRRVGDKFASSINEALKGASQDTLYNALLESSLTTIDGNDEFDSLDNDSTQNYRRNYDFEKIKHIVEQNEHNTNITNFPEEYQSTKENTGNAKAVGYKQNMNYLTEMEENNENMHNITDSMTHIENLQNATNEFKNITSLEIDFPKSAPFLVAIFETLSNVTAQTCAGTLIAPNWVLTGANCVNILSNLYANDTNMTDSQTLYTVVAGAIDPLSDGSAHNVTAVLQHQGFAANSTRNRKSIHVEIGPFLAMMLIEPPFEGVRLPLMEEKVKKGDVMIYGWILTKNESGLDTLNLVIMSALILSSAECQAMYSFNNNDVICLFNRDNETNITQVSSGGPVLILHGGEPKLLAVAQTDEHVFIAYPLYVHYNWIKTILNNNV